jgi:hypothetical protein
MMRLGAVTDMTRLGAVTAVLITTSYSTRMCWRNRTHARISFPTSAGNPGDPESGYQDRARLSS